MMTSDPPPLQISWCKIPQALEPHMGTQSHYQNAEEGLVQIEKADTCGLFQ